MTYLHKCPACGLVDIDMSVKEYPGSDKWLPCPRCIHAYAKRIFTAPYHQEDRYHHGGEHWNNSLGRMSPQSRAEIKLLEKQGVVFDSFSNPICDEAKAAVGYQKAIDAGATHEQAEAANPWPQAKPREIDVEGWKRRRHAAGKPLDQLVESEMTPELQAAGFSPQI